MPVPRPDQRPAPRGAFAILSACALALQLMLTGLAPSAFAGPAKASATDAGRIVLPACEASDADCCFDACLILDALEGPPVLAVPSRADISFARAVPDGVVEHPLPVRRNPPARAPPA